MIYWRFTAIDQHKHRDDFLLLGMRRNSSAHFLSFSLRMSNVRRPAGDDSLPLHAHLSRRGLCDYDCVERPTEYWRHGGSAVLCYRRAMLDRISVLADDKVGPLSYHQDALKLHDLVDGFDATTCAL